jgi:hypothetical protein
MTRKKERKAEGAKREKKKSRQDNREYCLWAIFFI